MRKVVIRVSVSVVAGALLSTCGGGDRDTDRSTDREADTFTYAVGEIPETFNPGLQDEHTDPVTELVFRGLTRYDKDDRIEPALAESWQISDDGKTYTFTLRPRLTWHDGRPLTADDVKFTVETVRDAGADSPLSGNFAMVTEVRAPNARTVQLKLSRPFGPMLGALSMGIVPKHALAGRKLTDPDFGQRPIGAGPFRLTKFKPGQYAELEPFTGFYRGRPQLNKITIEYVPDDATRLRLLDGEVDGAHLRPQQAEQVAADIDPDTKGGIGTRVYPSAEYRALVLNMKTPAFADKRVRRALNYAVDREAIVDSVLRGYGKPADGPLHEKTPYRRSSDYRFDPAEVAKLMKAAGYTRTGTGPWVKGGRPLAFRLSTFADDSQLVAILHVVAAQLKQQGFEVDAAPRPRGPGHEHWNDTQAFLAGSGAPYDPDVALYRQFHSSQVPDKGGSNFGFYTNPAADKALEEGRWTSDQTRRYAAYDRVQEVLHDDPPFVWLAYLQTFNAIPWNLFGPVDRTLGRDGHGFFWNAETWYYGAS